VTVSFPGRILLHGIRALLLIYFFGKKVSSLTLKFLYGINQFSIELLTIPKILWTVRHNTGLDTEQNTRVSRWDLHTVLPCIPCGTSEKFPARGKEKEASDFTGCTF
jgi:hypothetical protein